MVCRGVCRVVVRVVCKGGCAERGVGGVSIWDGWCYDEGRLLAGEVGEGEVEYWVDAEDEVLWQAVDFAAFRWVDACLYLTVE